LRLSENERHMYSGENGLLIREAISFLISLGEAFGAEKLVDISYANIILGSSFWGKGKITTDLVSDSVDQGLKVKVPTTLNNWGLWDEDTSINIWNILEVPENIRKQVIWENELAIKMGIIPTCTCAPYLNCDIRTFPKGTYISTVESSAIVYFNSVLGVKANRDCVASFFASITGKYPLCGLFLQENRIGNILFELETKIDSPIDYGLLGIFAGRIAGKKIPVFNGIQQPKSYSLMQLSSSLASSGAISMFHIIGITPEAPDFHSAFAGKQPEEKIIVNEKTLVQAYEELSDLEGQVDFICLGCPHYSIYELAEIADLLEGKKIHNNVTLWICTSPATSVFAEMAGYSKKIKNSGAIIMSGPNFCPIFGPGKPSPEYTFRNPNYSIGNFATDAVKQAFYAKPNLRAKKVFLGTKKQCINAAITGIWSGGKNGNNTKR